MIHYQLLNNNLEIFPIFWENKHHNIAFLPMGDNGKWITDLTPKEIINQELFNQKICDFAEKTKADLVLSGFLENREHMFRTLGCEQMVEQWRFFHLWLDVSAPVWTSLYAPLDGEVVISMEEEWYGNYGGVLVLKHELNGEFLYSLYGHQNIETLPEVWSFIKAGEKIAELWDYSGNGWYFHHLHLQLLTQKWFDEGFVSKGYTTAESLATIEEYVPNPNFIFRFS